MAVDIAEVCRDSAENQSGSDLAIWLCVMFSIYTIISIALSALTIYTSSQVGPPGAKSGRPRSVAGYLGGALDSEAVPLIALGGRQS